MFPHIRRKNISSRRRRRKERKKGRSFPTGSLSLQLYGIHNEKKIYRNGGEGKKFRRENCLKTIRKITRTHTNRN